MLLFGTLGFRVGQPRSVQWRRLQRFRNRRKLETEKAQVLERMLGDHFRKTKLLDTSELIDGRVLPIAKTGFIVRTMLDSNFVLQALQQLSDSAASKHAMRGRRGLDILNAMQMHCDIHIAKPVRDLADKPVLDSCLLKLAKHLDGIVKPKAFNLNMLAQFQNVPVLNINALANALKPDVIPGENKPEPELKSGSERQLRVATLDDGTMVVVVHGKFTKHKPLVLIVTSAY